MNKIRIAYCISTFRNAGPIKVLYNIIKNIDFNKFECTVISFSGEPENTLIGDFKELPISIIQLKLSRLRGLLYLNKTVLEVIKRERIEVVHSHGLRPDIVNASISKHVKSVTTLHNFPIEDYVFKYGKVKGNIAAYFHNKYLKRIEAKIACSKSLQKKILDQGNLKNVKCIQNGIEPITQIDSELLKSDLNIKEDDFVLIYTGSLIKRKNPISLVRAFLKLKDKNFKLLILGDGPMAEEVVELSKEDSRIIFVGFKYNIPDYLLLSDAYISPSYSEGLPNAVLEGMSANLIPILSNIPQHRELFIMEGHQELLFDPSNEGELIKSIMYAYEIKTSDIRLNVKSIVENNFTGQLMSSQYQEIYIDLIRNE